MKNSNKFSIRELTNLGFKMIGETKETFGGDTDFIFFVKENKSSLYLITDAYDLNLEDESDMPGEDEEIFNVYLCDDETPGSKSVVKEIAKVIGEYSK